MSHNSHTPSARSRASQASASGKRGVEKDTHNLISPFSVTSPPDTPQDASLASWSFDVAGTVLFSVHIHEENIPKLWGEAEKLVLCPGLNLYRAVFKLLFKPCREGMGESKLSA